MSLLVSVIQSGEFLELLGYVSFSRTSVLHRGINDSMKYLITNIRGDEKRIVIIVE